MNTEFWIVVGMFSFLLLLMAVWQVASVGLFAVWAVSFLVSLIFAIAISRGEM